MFCQRLSAPGGESCRWQMCAERVVAVLLVPKFTTPFAAHQAGGQKKWPTLGGGVCKWARRLGVGWWWGNCVYMPWPAWWSASAASTTVWLSSASAGTCTLTWTSPVYALTPELNWHYSRTAAQRWGNEHLKYCCAVLKSSEKCFFVCK